MGVQHAKDLDLPEICMLNASVLSSDTFLLHFLSKVALTVPSKPHLDPPGTGAGSPEREIREPWLVLCKKSSSS